MCFGGVIEIGLRLGLRLESPRVAPNRRLEPNILPLNALLLSITGLRIRSVENGGGGMHISWTTEIGNFLQFFAFNERHGVR